MRRRFEKKPPYLPLFVADYQLDTGELTLEEDGAYLRLIMHAWVQPDCGLTTDNRKIARILGISGQKWAQLKKTILPMWTLDGDRWYQERLYAERLHAETRSQMASKAAAARWHDEETGGQNQKRPLINSCKTCKGSIIDVDPQTLDKKQLELCGRLCGCNATQPQPQYLEDEEDEGSGKFELVGEDGAEPPDIYAVVVDAWNRAAEQSPPMARCATVNDDRRKGISKLVAEYGLETVVEQIGRLPSQGFVAAGGTHGDWKPGIDFLFRKGKFTRLMEGGYAQRPGKKSGWR